MPYSRLWDLAAPFHACYYSAGIWSKIPRPSGSDMLTVFALGRSTEDFSLHEQRAGEMQLMHSCREGDDRLTEQLLLAIIAKRILKLDLDELNIADWKNWNVARWSDVAVSSRSRTFEYSFGALDGGADDTSVFVWAVEAEDEFIMAVKNRRPLTLAVMAYWGWFSDGWESEARDWLHWFIENCFHDGN